MGALAQKSSKFLARSGQAVKFLRAKGSLSRSGLARVRFTAITLWRHGGKCLRLRSRRKHGGAHRNLTVIAFWNCRIQCERCKSQQQKECEASYQQHGMLSTGTK